MDSLYHALPLSLGHAAGASEEQGILNICAAYTSAKTWNATAPSSQIQASYTRYIYYLYVQASYQTSKLLEKLAVILTR